MHESQSKEDPHARNVRQVANRCVFSMMCGSAGSKSRLAKAAGAEVAAQSRQEKLHAAVARSTFQVKLYCTKHLAIGALLEVGMWKMARRCGAKRICKSKCAKHTRCGALLDVYAAVARSTFASQNVKKVRCTDHFLSKLPKIAHHCGAKQIYKSKCQKHLRFAPLLKVSLCKLTN